MPPNSVLSVPPRPRPARIRAVGLLAGAVALTGTAACGAALSPSAGAEFGSHHQAVDSRAAGDCQHRDPGVLGVRVPIARVRLHALDAVARASAGWLFPGYSGASAPCGPGLIGAVAQAAAAPGRAGAAVTALVPGGVIEQ